MSVGRRNTVIHNFLARSEQLADTVVFRWPSEVDGHWETATGRELVERARERAAGLLSLGLGPGDRVGIICRTSPEWFLADMSIQHAGGIVVPLFSEFSDEVLSHCINEAECRYLFIDDDEVLERLESLTLPSVRALFMCGSHLAQPGTISVAKLCARGLDFMKAQPKALAERLTSVDESDVFTIVYTSGTTAAPKGVMLTHRNAICAGTGYLKRMPVAEHQVYVSYCPLSHISERLATTVISTITDASPGEIWFVPDTALLTETLKKARPTSLAGPPIVWMKLRARILASVEAKGGRFAARLMDIATEVARERAEGQPVRADRALAAWLAHELVGRPVRRHLGLDRLLCVYSGAAALPEEVQYFFEGLGVPVRQAWGLTETFGAGAAQSVGESRAGLVGAAHEGVEIRLAPDGEILVRSECVFPGYWKRPDQTQTALDAEGWLHTGDLGELLSDGRLRLIDRKKSCFALSTGRKVWPQRMELAMRASPLVADAVALGEGQAHPALLLALDPEEVRARILNGGDAPELDPSISAEIQRRIDRFNASVAEAERIGAWRIVRGLFPESVYTSTRKIRRDVFVETFAAEIARLYEDNARLPT